MYAKTENVENNVIWKASRILFHFSVVEQRQTVTLILLEAMHGREGATFRPSPLPGTFVVSIVESIAGNVLPPTALH